MDSRRETRGPSGGPDDNRANITRVVRVWRHMTIGNYWSGSVRGFSLSTCAGSPTAAVSVAIGDSETKCGAPPSVFRATLRKATSGEPIAMGIASCTTLEGRLRSSPRRRTSRPPRACLNRPSPLDGAMSARKSHGWLRNSFGRACKQRLDGTTWPSRLASRVRSYG